MTIDKAIEKYKKLANNDTTCYQEEAQQLAEWLEELKKLRQCTNIENREYPYFNGFKEGKQVGYNKAIDDFVKMAKELKHKYGALSNIDLDYIAGFLRKESEEHE